ncbi:MAG: sigma-E factor negative regulatory protein [Betaproteobacteria bacterium]|nr:sigma-E factor negative regulatory protein [Betaproteobacteria bacterium]
MNEKLSALMDGELSRDEAVVIIKAAADNDDAHAEWDCYHLIRDVLKDEGVAHGDWQQQRQCTAAIFERLSQEPTVLAPVNSVRPVAKQTRVALAMAASVVTVSAIGVVALKQQQGATVAPVQLVQQTAPKALVAETLVAETASVPLQKLPVNDYLWVHRQFYHPEALQSATFKQDAPAKRASKW